MNSTAPTKKQLHNEIAANFRANWDDGSDDLVKRVLDELEAEIGMDRLRLAVRNFLANEKFFSEAALRQYIPAYVGERRYCRRCEKRGGYIMVMVEGEPCPRAFKCIHDDPTALRRVKIGPLHTPERREVSATDCDYLPAEYQDRRIESSGEGA